MSSDFAVFVNNTLAESNLASASTLSSHTGDGTIHFTQASISIPASQVSDFDTEVSNNIDVSANTSARHSAVTVLDSSEIDFTLTGQQITASLKSGSIDESKLDTSVNSSLDLADSALQTISGLNISLLTNDSGYTTNTGTVTSVAISGSDGIEIDSGSPITTSGTIALGVNKTTMLSTLNVEDGAEVNNISDINATDLTDNGESTLHYHSADRNRANHTGTQTASTISNFVSTVQANSINNVVEDTTPQLGGDLDINAKKIKLGSTGTLDIYASDGTTLLMKLDTSGNLGIKGRVYSL